MEELKERMVSTTLTLKYIYKILGVFVSVETRRKKEGLSNNK